MAFTFPRGNVVVNGNPYPQDGGRVFVFVNTMTTYTLKEQWQLTRRLFRVLRDIPMKLEPTHIATVWVKVPNAIAEYLHLVDSVAQIDARQVVARDYPELCSYGFRVESWSGYSLDLRWIESQDNFRKGINRCQVWLTGPNPAPIGERLGLASQTEPWGYPWLEPDTYEPGTIGFGH